MKNNPRPLQKMFNEVPQRYDLMNRILTFRMDEMWRRKTVTECLKNYPSKVLDLCTGTGDLALRLAKKADGSIEVIGVDFSEPMMEVARKKALKKSINNIRFVYGDVAELPFPSNHFDSIGIGFAFRNLTYKNPNTRKYLSEILRVLKKNGRFVIVETSQPENMLMRKLYHFYMKNFVAIVGGFLSGHRAAYRYLAHSARNYYNPLEVETLLNEAGFAKTEHISLMTGMAAIYIAKK